MAFKLSQWAISGTTPSSATTATVGSVVSGLGQASEFTITASLVGATGGTLDVYLQRFDGVLNQWVDWIHFPQLAAAAAAIRYTVTPSKFASGSIVVTGIGTSPALAANTSVGGHPGDQLRCIATGGASTSAGAAITISILGHTGA